MKYTLQMKELEIQNGIVNPQAEFNVYSVLILQGLFLIPSLSWN